MPEVRDECVALVVTSPPYWHIKDYGVEGQIGYGQSLHEYLIDLSRVWRECWRVMMPGRRLCINIGDQFARASVYGQYKVIPLHAEIIAQCEVIGFDYLGAIIWQKKTTMRPSGGAVVMGSFPYPPNGIIEIDYEYILLFRKPGKSVAPSLTEREASAMTKEEWKTYFSGHWQFAGERQVGHEAMFPEELPHRLIRMFSFVGETVLDPFAGSGTTLKAALALERHAIGYEIQLECIPIARNKLEMESLLPPPLDIVIRQRPASPVNPPDYTPQIKNALPPAEVQRPDAPKTYRVLAVHTSEATTPVLCLDNGWQVSLLGIIVPREKLDSAIQYLKAYIVSKRVIVQPDEHSDVHRQPIPAYIRLTNRIFVNREMVKMGLAVADRTCNHKYLNTFLQLEDAGG